MFNDTRITSVHPSGWLNLLHTCKRSLFVPYTHSQTYICIPHLFGFNFPIILPVFIYLLSTSCPNLVCCSLTIIFRRVGDTLICLADFAVKWSCFSRILLHCLFSNSFHYSFIFFSSNRACDTAAVPECLTQCYQGQEGTISQEHKHSSGQSLVMYLFEYIEGYSWFLSSWKPHLMFRVFKVKDAKF